MCVEFLLMLCNMFFTPLRVRGGKKQLMLFHIKIKTFEAWPKDYKEFSFNPPNLPHVYQLVCLKYILCWHEHKHEPGETLIKGYVYYKENFVRHKTIERWHYREIRTWSCQNHLPWTSYRWPWTLPQRPPGGKWLCCPTVVCVHSRLPFAPPQVSDGHHSYWAAQTQAPIQGRDKKSNWLEENDFKWIYAALNWWAHESVIWSELARQYLHDDFCWNAVS